VTPKRSKAALAAARAGIVAVIVAATLAFGSVHRPSRLSVVVAAAAAAVAAVFVARRTPTPAVGRIQTVWIAAAALAALPLVPVGAGLRAALQPGLADAVGTGFALAGVGVAPLAVHPTAAASALAFIGAGLLVSRASGALARREVDVLGPALIVSAGVTAALALLQRSFGWTTIVPWWSVGRGATFFGPFVYENHAAVLLSAAAVHSLATGLGRKGEIAFRSGLAALAFAVAAVATGSRGAPLLLAAGAFVVCLADRRVAVRRAGAAGAAAAALLGAWFAWVGADKGVASGRHLLVPDLATAFLSAPWFGGGPASFLDVWRTTRPSIGFVAVRHAHQELGQALIEHGVFATAVAVVALSMTLWAAVRRIPEVRDDRWRRDLVGAVAVIGVLLTSSAWDFPLRSGALALIAGAAVGTALARGEHREDAERRSLRAAWVTVAVAVPTLALAAWSRDPAFDADGADEAAIMAHLSSRPLDSDAMVARARRAAEAEQLDVALRWLDAARAVGPRSPDAWLLTARVRRAARDIPGARSAYRSFLDLDLPQYTDEEYVYEALTTTADPVGDLDEIVPERWDRRCVAAMALVRRGHPGPADALFESLADHDWCRVAWGLNLYRRGEAARAVEVATPARPDCGRSRTLGLSYTALERWEPALEHLTDALATCIRKDAELRASIGVARLALGDASGIAVLEVALSEHPDLHLGRHALANALAASGRWHQVVEVLEPGFLDDTLTDDEIVLYGRAIEATRPR
jgi:tetratricopeptide (TPR) repeat protein